jgi:hypothetical protein
MAAEYNLISAPQYDRLMKLQKKMDGENNASKKHLLGDEKETPSEHGVKRFSNDKALRVQQDVHGPHGLDKIDGSDDNGSDGDRPMDTNAVSNNDNGARKTHTKVAHSVRDIVVGKKVDGVADGNVKSKHKRKESSPVKFENVPADVVEGIVEQFNDLLKKKVKRLISYMFKFGRDITLDKGILYYKKGAVGDVVKLIKSLFGVIPPMKGLRKLRKVLFILSVPSDLYILTTSERKKLAEKYSFDKEETNPFKIDWLKY